MAIVIGIAGRMRSGKDTVAQMLIDMAKGTQLKLVRRGMADSVKEDCAKIASDLLGLDYHVVLAQMHSDGPEKERWRLLMKWVGTEGWRYEDSDHWVKVMRHYLSGFQNPKTIVLIPDIRFENEAALVHELDGLLINVYRPGCDTSDNHASECELAKYDKWNGEVINDGSLEDLQAKVAQLFILICNWAGVVDDACHSS